jgi:hypothetical protein
MPRKQRITSRFTQEEHSRLEEYIKKEGGVKGFNDLSLKNETIREALQLYELAQEVYLDKCGKILFELNGEIEEPFIERVNGEPILQHSQEQKKGDMLVYLDMAEHLIPRWNRLVERGGLMVRVEL